MRRILVVLSVLLLAIVCLFCSKDPKPPVHHIVDNPEPSISIILEDGVNYSKAGIMYPFGIYAASNVETQVELARIVVSIDNHVLFDSVISGVEYCFMDSICFSLPCGDLVMFPNIMATVTDASGETNSDESYFEISLSGEGEVHSLPYCQSFDDGLTTSYMTYDVLGSQSWSEDIEDVGTMMMSGSESGMYYANEDWLVFSPVNLSRVFFSSVHDAKMTIVYSGRYFDDINEDVTIWASINYCWGNAPSTATWTQIPAFLVQSSYWSNFKTTEIALTQFVGKTVTLAVKYESRDGKSAAGTLRIKSVTIEEGEASVSEEPPTPPAPGELDYSNLVLNELNGDIKFIEFYNKGNYDLSMEGMYLMKDDFVDPIWTGDATIVVPAHGYLVLYSEDVAADYPLEEANYFFHSGLSSKKTIRFVLYMPDGTERDIYYRGLTGEWGYLISDVSPLSYARTPDGGDWKLAEATPGNANHVSGDEIPQE